MFGGTWGVGTAFSQNMYLGSSSLSPWCQAHTPSSPFLLSYVTNQRVQETMKLVPFGMHPFSQKEIKQKNHGVDYYYWKTASWPLLFYLFFLLAEKLRLEQWGMCPRTPSWLLAGPGLKGTQRTIVSATVCFLHVWQTQNTRKAILNVCPNGIWVGNSSVSYVS